MDVILGIFFLATFIEGLINYVAGDSDGVPRAALKYVGLVVGVVVAIAYKVDIPTMVGLTTAWPIVNYIVSGIIIGRGSNYVHDVLGSINR